MKFIFILLLSICCSFLYAQQKDTLYFSSAEINRIEVGKNYYYQFGIKNPSQKHLIYWVNNLPLWLHFNKTNGTLSGSSNKAGQYPMRLFASNGKDTVHQFFMLTVFNHQTTNILLLGNSITHGNDKHNGYKRSLWQMLHNGNYNFDMIGSLNKQYQNAEAPNPDFDLDHEGHAGWTYEDILKTANWDTAVKGNIYTWLQTYNPDIVIVELGTNDVFHCRKIQDIKNDMATLVNILRIKNKNIKIFMQQIPPLGKQWADKKLCGDSISYHQRIVELNIAVAAFAKEYTTKISPVIVVDQFTGIDASVDTYDDIHPNNKGEKIMAERWFNAIKQYVKKIDK